MLVSTENHVPVTSLAINEDHIKSAMRYDVEVEASKKALARELCRKVFNEEHYFTEVSGSDGEELIVPAKKYRNSDISDDLIIKL